MRLPPAFAVHFAAALGAGVLLAAGIAFESGRSGGGEDAQIPTISAIVPAPADTDRTTGAEAAGAGAPLPASDAAESALLEDDTRPVLAILIDDVGLSERAFAKLEGLNTPVTLSFLPYGEAVPEMARRAASAGHEVFLHLPMEPVGLDDPGPMALTRHLDAEETERRVLWALSRVPGAAGANNHMGSALTADGEAMHAALRPLAGRGLVFVDSVTSPRSAAAREAAGLGLHGLRRDVFLDNDPTAEAIEARLDDAFEAARARGWAIAIGHPHAATLDTLDTLKARAERAGIRIVPVRAIADRLNEDPPAS